MLETTKKIVLLMLSANFIISCSKEETNTNTDTASVMLIHASPDAPAVDIYKGTSKINSSSIVYAAAPTYFIVSTGNQSFDIKQAGTGVSLFSTATLPFTKNKAYSVFIVDSAVKASAIRFEDNLVAPAAGKINFRMLHLSPNTANVDFILRSGADSIALTNKAFKETTDLLAIDGKTYTIKAKLAGTQTVVASASGIILSSGKIYTLFLKGFSGGTGTSDAGIQVIQYN